MNVISEYIVPFLISLGISSIVYFATPLAIHWFQHVFPRTVDSRALARQSNRLADFAFGLAIPVALVGLTAQTIHLYDSFGSYVDFANFDQILWDLLRSGPSDYLVFYLSRRFDPILFALVPLYALWANPRILLLLQSVGFVSAAFPVYWYARRQIGHWMAFSVVLVYLSSSILNTINEPVFYEIKLAVPLLAFAVYFLLRRRYSPFLVCLGVTLLVKQEVAFIALAFAAFIFLVQRKRVLGLALVTFGAVLIVGITQFFYPLVGGSRTFPQLTERYAYLGDSLGQVLLSMFSHPEVILRTLIEPSKIEFALHLLATFAFLPLLGIEVTAISIPTLAYTLLSKLPQQYDPGQYYQSPFLPFLLFGTVLGLKRLLDWKVIPNRRRKTFALLALLLASSQLYLPSVWQRVFDLNSFSVHQHNVLGHNLIRQIPSGSVVIAQTEFVVPLLAERRFRVSELEPTVDYRKADYLFGDATRLWYSVRQVTWEEWRASGYFEPVVEQDGYFLLHRKPITDPSRQFDTGQALLGYTSKPDPFARPLGFQFGETLTLLGYNSLPSGKIRGGSTLRVIAEWQVDQPIHDRYVILAHLVDEQGHVWATDDREPIQGLGPTDQWRVGDIMRDQYTFSLPPTMPPGNYHVMIGIWDPKTETSLTVRDVQQHPIGIEAVIGDILVDKDTSSIPASFLTIEHPFHVDMHELRYLGSTDTPHQLAPGELLQIGLYWRARDKPLGDYEVAIQLRDSGEFIALEQTSRPAEGAYPTTVWQPGEVLLDWHDITVPADFAPGNYTVIVVLRDKASQVELGTAAISKIAVVK